MTNWELYTRDYDEEHLRREVTQSLSLISGRTALNCHAGIVAFGGILLLPELAFPMESWTRIASGKTQKTSSIGLFLGDIAPEPADDSHNKLYKWVAIGMLGTSALLRTIASSGSDAQVCLETCFLRTCPLLLEMERQLRMIRNFSLQRF